MAFLKPPDSLTHPVLCLLQSALSLTASLDIGRNGGGFIFLELCKNLSFS
jgi:hypothetical protein